MELKNFVLKALILHLEAEKAAAKVNLDNYLYNSAGIGEHPDIMEECSKLLKQIDESHSALETLKQLYPDELQG
jgi:hypothetical protein